MRITTSRFHQSAPPSRRSIEPAGAPDTVTLSEAQPRERTGAGWGAVVFAGLGLLSACKHPSPPPEPPAQEVVDPQTCNLIFIDSFNGSHGPTVEKTSRSLGEFTNVHRFNQADKVGGELPFQAITRRVGRELGERELTRDEASRLLDLYIVDLYSEPMGLLTSLMQDANSLGVSNSALNISLGLNKLHMVTGAESHTSNAVYRTNLDRALGLNPQSTGSQERKQALLDRVNRVMEGSEEVRSASQAWQDEVRAFEANRNSVVVSAGNDGGDARSLSSKGYRLSEDVDRNFLAFSDVTVVGATNGGSSVAGYSRRGDEVDLYASGNAGLLTQGTSFASPRVSAAMRAAHCQNPDLDSDQVEELVLEQLTDSIQVDGESRSTLNLDRAKQFIAGKR